MALRTALPAFLLSLATSLQPVSLSAADELAPDVLRLRRVDITDVSGFGQPVAAASILLPVDWQVESGVRWATDVGCPQNVIQLSLRASSPDGRLGFEVFPDFSWEWYEDPVVRQYAQQAEQFHGMRGCELLPPFDGVGYLQQVFLPRWRPGSSVVDIGRVEELVESMRLQLQALTGGIAGMVQTDVDVALATLETPRGGTTDSEWILIGLLHTAAAMPTVSGLWTGALQTAASYKSAAVSQFAARAPKGELERHERLFEVIYRSFRIDPRWDAARLQFWQTIDRVVRKGTQDRLRIMEDSRREIGAIIDQVYESRQGSLDRRFERQSQALRGVEVFVDPTTRDQVELSTGYAHAWTNGLGDYLLSNSPGFDPTRELGGNWRALARE